MNKKSFILIAALLSSVASASIKPICRSGALPQTFHGTYAIPTSNTLIQLTSNKLLFSGMQGAYFHLKSCLANGKRVVTITDGNPQSTQNFSVIQMSNRNLLVEDLDLKETQVWRFVLR